MYIIKWFFVNYFIYNIRFWNEIRHKVICRAQFSLLSVTFRITPRPLEVSSPHRTAAASQQVAGTGVNRVPETRSIRSIGFLMSCAQVQCESTEIIRPDVWTTGQYNNKIRCTRQSLTSVQSSVRLERPGFSSGKRTYCRQSHLSSKTYSRRFRVTIFI